MSHSYLSSESFWTFLVVGIVLVLLLLMLIPFAKSIGDTIDEIAEVMWLKKGRECFYRGVVRILTEFDDDEQASKEILLLYQNTANQFYVLKKEKLVSAWDMLSDFTWRIDAWKDDTFQKKYGVENARPMRKRIARLRDSLKEDFRYPYVEGEQAHLFKALGTAIRANDQATASELLEEMASFIKTKRDIEQRRTKQSLRWTIGGTITGIFGLVITIISIVKP